MQKKLGRHSLPADGVRPGGRTRYMETTKIEAAKTVMEIQEILVQSGAVGVFVEYDAATREPTAVGFQIEVSGRRLPFLLPVRVEPVFRHLQGRRDTDKRAAYTQTDREQANRVAWRQIFRWTQAQLALLESEMVELAEIYLPYLQVAIDRTLFRHLKDAHFKGLLTNGGVPKDEE